MPTPAAGAAAHLNKTDSVGAGGGRRGEARHVAADTIIPSRPAPRPANPSLAAVGRPRSRRGLMSGRAAPLARAPRRGDIGNRSTPQPPARPRRRRVARRLAGWDNSISLQRGRSCTFIRSASRLRSRFRPKPIEVLSKFTVENDTRPSFAPHQNKQSHGARREPERRSAHEACRRQARSASRERRRGRGPTRDISPPPPDRRRFRARLAYSFR
ncbi:hypothetical protein EVAR_51540_1 [Eumeta japonica]|uniref:Uncharacterized protein n=1 Tax=Eumeta variegata TaxID=151549 RepID=A0A4C1XFE3_EUMVA|nr:hypothetical protein EVAR_51540_1 [Eumeta japonica]